MCFFWCSNILTCTLRRYFEFIAWVRSRVYKKTHLNLNTFKVLFTFVKSQVVSKPPKHSNIIRLLSTISLVPMVTKFRYLKFDPDRLRCEIGHRRPLRMFPGSSIASATTTMATCIQFEYMYIFPYTNFTIGFISVLDCHLSDRMLPSTYDSRTRRL